MKIQYILILTLLIFSCKPESTPVKNIDKQGHRGCRGLMPENTVPGFIKALEYKVETLELDVVISKDRKVVVSHEPWFSHEICTKPDGSAITDNEDKDLKIFEMTLEEIQQYDCGQIGHSKYPEQQKTAAYKPELREVIEAVEAHIKSNNLAPVYYNIETKSRPQWDSVFTPAPKEFIDLLYQQILALGIKDRTIIQSFDPRTLEELHKLDAAITTAFLISNTKAVDKNLESLSYLPEIYSPNFLLMGQKTVTDAQEAGMKIIPWTVNKKKDMKKLMAMGVDGIITDYPDRLLEVVQEK